MIYYRELKTVVRGISGHLEVCFEGPRSPSGQLVLNVARGIGLLLMCMVGGPRGHCGQFVLYELKPKYVHTHVLVLRTPRH